ncbi:MAG TPA: hypothetical protein VFT72_17445 [Opitutaceae bacterium]|nr:hypothetical protein [Opitutaceae bacterium]
MSSPLRLASFRWVFLLILACAFVCWTNRARIQRVEFVTGLVPTSAVPDAHSQSGYAGGLRQLIVPEHNDTSYQWIVQTQQMRSRGEWRLRHVDYDNAPKGRETRESSPYRWWLGFVSWLEQIFGGRNPGIAVEHAALHADPLLQLAVLVSAVIFARKFFGETEAIVLCVGLAVLFPFAGLFIAGQPDDKALTAFLLVWSVLPLIAGMRVRLQHENNDARARESARRWFMLAGFVGGLGIWVSPLAASPMLLGLGLGAILQGRFHKTFEREWTWWSLIGASTTFLCYLVEFAPNHLLWNRLEAVHPLYGVAWLGLGSLAGLAHREAATSARRLPLWLKLLRREISVTAVLALPAFLFIPHGGYVFIGELQATRLTRLPNSPVAANLLSWFARDGVNLVSISTLLPLLFALPLIWLILRRTKRDPSATASSMLPLIGGSFVALILACAKLSEWNTLDAALLLLLVGALALESDAIAPTRLLRHRWICVLVLVLAVLPGSLLVAKQAVKGQDSTVTETEVQALVERDLSHWLANRVGPAGAIVLAPPELTTSLIFHGGLRGLSTPYPENKDGFAAAVRIAGATSQDEALSLVERRQVTHIVVPTWDNALETFAALGTDKPQKSLVGLLNQWVPPRWLRAVPYRVPTIPGVENQRVAVFERVELQDNPLALARLEDYFIEMGAGAPAAAIAQTLESQFPQDINSLIARASLAVAVGDAAKLQGVLDSLIPKIANVSDALPLDRRVVLAVALAEAKHFDLARAEVEGALRGADEAALRGLSTSQLYRLSAMMKAFGLSFPDPRLRELALSLLPSEYRDRL